MSAVMIPPSALSGLSPSGKEIRCGGWLAESLATNIAAGLRDDGRGLPASHPERERSGRAEGDRF